jgi:uncharacterized protein (DUF433 family)
MAGPNAPPHEGQRSASFVRLSPFKGGRYDESVSATPYQSIITLEPGKRGGKPTIRGLRITVYDVLSYLAAGMTPQEILVDFPSLTEEDIQACLSYAAERERQVLVARA